MMMANDDERNGDHRRFLIINDMTNLFGLGSHSIIYISTNHFIFQSSKMEEFIALHSQSSHTSSIPSQVLADAYKSLFYHSHFNHMHIIYYLFEFLFIYNILQPRSSMNSLASQDRQPSKEAELFQDLSHFLKMFRQVAAHIQRTLISIQKGNEYHRLIDKIHIIICQMDMLQVKYNIDCEGKQIDPATFNRFASRLVEVVSLLKIKYQNVVISPSTSCFMTFIRQLQNAIQRYQQEKLLGRMIELIQIISVKFCLDCVGASRIGNINGVGEQQMSQALKSFSQKIQFFSQKYKRSNQKICAQLSSCTKTQTQLEKFKAQDKKIPYVGQTLVEMQRRFDVFKGIDIEYTYFKTSYFDSKNCSETLFKQYYGRNNIVCKAISLYNTEYSEFLQRQANKKNRKLRNKQQSQKLERSLDEGMKVEVRQSKQQSRLKKGKHYKTYDEKSLNQKLFSSCKQNNLSSSQIDINKVSYKLKKVYITLGRKTIAKQIAKNSYSPTIFRKRVFQNQSNNQSFTNEIIHKSSTTSLVSKSKHITDQRNEQRLKTEASKVSGLQAERGQQVEKNMEKVIGYVKASKEQVKGKYIQFNYLEIPKETNLKSRALKCPNKLGVKNIDRDKFKLGLLHI